MNNIQRSQLSVFVLLWLVGVAVRLTLLAVPPVTPKLEEELGLTGAGIGVLMTLPVALFGAAALLGSLLIARLGALTSVAAGLVIGGLMSALRALPVDGYLLLYAASAAMGAGIAIVHPAIPALIREWLPSKISLGSAVFTNGLLVGETLPAALSVDVVLPLLDGSWRANFLFWSIPLFFVALFAIRARAWSGGQPPSPERTGWWPDWRSPDVWQVGLVFGAVNSTYFGANAFLPGHLAAAGRPDLISAALTALNLCQLPASFVILPIIHRLERRPAPFIVAGLLMLLCVIAIASTAGAWTVLFAGILGAVIAVLFTLGLALPPLLSTPSGVARLSAAVFTISYTEALVIATLAGATADWLSNRTYAFALIAITALPLLVVPAVLDFKRSRQAAA